MTGKQLKNSILQLAIQGKLVPQDPHDEPASELLKRIRKEKEQLVKEGKLKKKDLESTPITEEEKPFEIPETWEWVRISSLSVVVRGGSPRPAGSLEFYEGSIPFMCVADLTKDESMFVNSASKTIKEAGLKKTRMVDPNTLLLSNSGATLGVPKINTFSTTFNDGIAAFLYLSDCIKPFLYWFFRSQTDILRNINQGTAQPNLNTDIIRNIIVPLPPLSEQHRIVEKIEELMPLVEEYDKAQSELDKLNESLPEQLKKSILQQAIMGKLVPQDPNDEPASELLKRIHKEKENLVKSGALKKKDLITTPISDDEKPFEIPESWEWVRLKEIVYNNGQKTPDKTFSYIDIGSINNKTQKLNVSETILEASAAPSRARKIVKMGDIVYSTVRPYLHNMAIIDKDFDVEPIASTGFAVLSTIIVYNKFLFYFLLSPQFDEYANDGDNAKGIAYPAINDEKLYKAIIPLPPLSEQHRIVAKIEELFNILK